MRNNNIILILASIIGLSFIGSTAKAVDGYTKDSNAALDFYNKQVAAGWGAHCSTDGFKTELVFTLLPKQYIKLIEDTFSKKKKYTIPSGNNTVAQELFEQKAQKMCPVTECLAPPKGSNVQKCKSSENYTELKNVMSQTIQDLVNIKKQDTKVENKTIKTDDQIIAEAKAIEAAKIKEKEVADAKAIIAQKEASEKQALDNAKAQADAAMAKGESKSIGNNQTQTTYKSADGKTTIDIIEKDEIKHSDGSTVKSVEKVLVNGKEIPSTEVDKALAKLPPEEAKKFKDSIDDKSAAQEKLDEEGKAAETKGHANADNVAQKLNSYANQMSASKCQKDPQTQQPIPPCDTKVDDIKTKIIELIEKNNVAEKHCINRSTLSDKFCSVTRNDTLKKLSVGMAAASTALQAMPGAAKICETTSSINMIGQSIMLGASLSCEGFRAACGISCNRSTRLLGEIAAEADKLSGTSYTGPEAGLISAAARSELEVNVEPHIATCKKHALDTATMVTSAMGMLTAYGQAKACEQQLAAMEGTNNTAQLYTMDEMCAQPQNANSTMCKCRADNTAVGCPGHIAGSGNEGNINKDLNTKGTSNMAGLSYGSKIAPTGGASALDTNLDGLSDEAKKALAAGGDQKQDGSMFGGAGAASAGGGSGTASAAGAASGAEKKLAEESKSIGSSFMNAVGSLFGKGGSGGKTSAAKEDKFASDKYKEQIKRQIAAEQMRNEISSASGMDNWTKIRTRYKSNAGSLIDSN